MARRYAGELGDDAAERDLLGGQGARQLLAGAAASRARSALRAAASMLQQAAEMLPPDSSKHADALVELAGVLLNEGQLEGTARATLDRATAAAGAAGSDAALARAGMLDVSVELQLDGDRAIRAFGERRSRDASEVFERLEDHRGLSLLHDTRAQVRWFRGHCEAARIRLGRRRRQHPPLRHGAARDPCAWTASALQLAAGDVRPAIARCAALVDETRGRPDVAGVHPPAARPAPRARRRLPGGPGAARRSRPSCAKEISGTIHSAARSHEAEVAFLEGDLEGSRAGAPRQHRSSTQRWAITPSTPS